VQEVEVVQGTTNPSHVYFALPVLLTTWAIDGGVAEMTATAMGIEDMLARQYVAGATYTEDLDNNGLRQSYMNATVQIPTPSGVTGPFSTVIQVPLGILGSDPAIENPLLSKMIDDAVAALQKTAAG
jgi:hypothetical protein